MATTYYSSLYDATFYQGSATGLYTPRAPMDITRGVPFVETFTFTIATGLVLGLADQIRLIPALPKGFQVTRFCMTLPGYDSGTTLTANLGFASQALGVGIVTGITTAALRTGATFSCTDAQILAGSTAGGPVTATTNLQAIGDSDTLLIYVSAAATGAGTNGTTQVLVEGILP